MEKVQWNSIKKNKMDLNNRKMTNPPPSSDPLDISTYFSTPHALHPSVVLHTTFLSIIPSNATRDSRAERIKHPLIVRRSVSLSGDPYWHNLTPHNNLLLSTIKLNFLPSHSLKNSSTSLQNYSSESAKVL